VTQRRWSKRSEEIDGGRIRKLAIDQDSSPLLFDDVLRLWQQNADFRTFFSRLLAGVPFPAFRWETPPLTAATVQRPFECAVLDAPTLLTEPDALAFARQFRKAGEEDVISFPNLGRDAILVVPCPRGPLLAYGHLAAFVREAPDAQRNALWQCVGKVMEQRLGVEPVWLSTAGAGVAWLHVRLDSRPKYYCYRPYRDLPAECP